MNFTSKRLFDAHPILIPAVSKYLQSQLIAEGYTVSTSSLVTGREEIELTKGGIFKAILGLKSALKVTLCPEGEAIFAEAGVGIFGQQVVPSLITWFVAWPVLLSQIWGMIKQSKLDDHVMALIVQALEELDAEEVAREQRGIFCPECGIKTHAMICPSCGTKL